MKALRRLAVVGIMCAFALALSGELQAQQPSAISMTVRAGFDGYYAEGMWIPVRITVANEGPDVQGVLQIAGPGVRNADVEYTRPIELPSRSRKEVFMYVAVEGYASQLGVVLRDSQDLLAAAQVRLVQTSSSDLIYGVLADSPTAFQLLAEIDPVDGQGFVAQLAAADLPAASPAWDSLDVLIVSDYDTGQLSDAQRTALATWVAGGGRLIVAGGPNWQRTVAGLEALLPVIISGTQTVTDWSSVGAFAVGAEPLGAGQVSRVQVVPTAATLVGTHELPLIVRRRTGYGEVDFLAFDPALAPFNGWVGMTGVYRNLLAMGGDQPAWRSTVTRSWYNAYEALNAIPGLELPTTVQVCLFVGAYVFVIGPLNYFMLRRVKRRELAWLTIPTLVLLFSGISYLAGYGLRGTRPVLHRLSVVHVWDDSERAQVESLVGIFSPRRARYDVRVEGDVLLRPLATDAYVRSADPGIGGSVFEQGDAAFVRALQVDVGAIKSFAVEGHTSAPLFLSALGFAIDGQSAVLDGSVVNLSELTLRDAVVLAPGGTQRVGDVTPGEEIGVHVTLSAPRAVPAPPLTTGQVPPVGVLHVGPGTSQRRPYASAGYDTTVDDILGTGDYYADRETFRRYSLLSWLAGGYGSGGRGSGVFLVGWTDESPLDSSIVGRTYSTTDETLYIVRLSPERVVGAGRIQIPPGLMTWQVVDPGSSSSDGPYEAYMYQGYFTLRYEPRIDVGFESVDSLTLHLTSYGQAGPVPLNLQLWDYLTADWVVLEGLVWGDTPLSNPSRFVGPDGRIDVRVENPNTQQSVSVEGLDFTLVVER